MEVVDIAKICHEANKALCESVLDFSQVSWEQAPEWQRDSAILGVNFVRDNPDAPESATHDCWCKVKLEAGWVYGEIKDPDALTHPCLVPFEDLPFELRG